jgi:hypothetical protein
MRKFVLYWLSAFWFSTNAVSINVQDKITFYEVPLTCSAAPDIGCGSRIKPLFTDAEKQKSIREIWSNHRGTVIAVIWKNKRQENTMQSLFDKHKIKAVPITDPEMEQTLIASLKGKDKWYKGAETDLLSMEEAEIIAANLTNFAEEAKLVTEQEALAIRKDFEDYYKRELTTKGWEELTSEKTLNRWRKDGYEIYAGHIGEERTRKVAELFDSNASDTSEKGSLLRQEETQKNEE